MSEPAPEPVEQTDNRPTDDDGDQDVSQDPELDYSLGEQP